MGVLFLNSVFFNIFASISWFPRQRGRGKRGVGVAAGEGGHGVYGAAWMVV